MQIIFGWCHLCAMNTYLFSNPHTLFRHLLTFSVHHVYAICGHGLTVHQWRSRDFFRDRDETLSFWDRAETWKISRPRHLSFESEQRISIERKQSAPFCENTVNIGISNFCWFRSFYSILILYFQKCGLGKNDFRFWLPYIRRNEVLRGIFA